MGMLQRFRRHIAALHLPPGPALVAVSGGPDSVALLDLMSHSADLHRLELVVAHFDHGIHPDSAAVARRVGELARAMELRVECGSGTLGPHASETDARVARYAFLESVRCRLGAGAIVLAHHADDQAETVLMRVLAGSGPAGLSGMVAVSGKLVRPLLPFTRAELAHYVAERSLPVWIDPANADTAHKRAWLRTCVLPMLRQRLPDVESALLGLAGQSRRNRLAWEAMVDLVPGLDVQPETDGISVAGDPLRGYDSALAESLILAVARRVGCPLGPVRATRVLDLLVRGTSGSQVPLSRGWKAEISFGRLRLVRASTAVVCTSEWILRGQQGEGTWGPWRLAWTLNRAPEQQERVALTTWVTPEALTVRGWVAGERIRPLAGVGRRLIVRCFQDARVPRSRRHDWPVLARGQEVVWIPGVCRSDALVPVPGTEALRVDAELC